MGNSTKQPRLLLQEFLFSLLSDFKLFFISDQILKLFVVFMITMTLKSKINKHGNKKFQIGFSPLL